MTTGGLQHRVIAADAWRVPAPFRCFAVRSEEPRHASVARAPYGRVHRVNGGLLDDAALRSLSDLGRALMRTAAFSDITYAGVALEELAAAAPGVPDLVGSIAAGLQCTGVLGRDAGGYARSVAARIDYLGSCGAGFHNDVRDHWTGCLFWNLALSLSDVEFVMPHAGVRQALLPGDLIVFDPALAHGLCRPRDQGQAVAEHFEAGTPDQQIFLSGELPLSDAQWHALGSPWLPLQAQYAKGALDLMAAEFDERSGAIKSLRALAGCMQPGTRYAELD